MHVAIDHAFILLFKVGEVIMTDVYQVVNEDEYSDIVRKRQEEDWVIDDGEKFIAFVLKLQRQALTAKVHS